MEADLGFSNIANDVTLLYELSLAIGKSLDLQTSCGEFIKTLMARKNLSYASVWIKKKYLQHMELIGPLEENNYLYVGVCMGCIRFQCSCT